MVARSVWRRCASCTSENPNCFARLSSVQRRALTRGVLAPRKPAGAKRLLHLKNLAQLMQEPRINPGQVKDLVDRKAGEERITYEENALGIGSARRAMIVFRSGSSSPPHLPPPPNPRAPVSRGTQRLLHRLLERPSDRHRLADRLHLRRQRLVGIGELLEGEARDLDDAVVDRRLEARRRQAGDVVLQLVERVPDGEFRRDLGDRETRSPSRRARRTATPADSSRSRPCGPFGSTANWMLEPPVSTPISRMILIDASRMTWYSLSVSVCEGATVIESPVCTPIGSRFSIEQMMTTLSLCRASPPSRTLSSRRGTPRRAPRSASRGRGRAHDLARTRRRCTRCRRPRRRA
jgi:hypothetical protein